MRSTIDSYPPRQRAVLILREVLCWRKAAEVAELLGSTVVAVNSALQRACATLAARGVTSAARLRPVDGAQQDLLARYAAAFERYDVDALVALLHEDATMSMPPLGVVAAGPRADPPGAAGVGSAMQGLPPGAGGGQRVTGVCPVHAHRSGGRPGAVGARGGRGRGWPDRRMDVLP
jgi:RNA polymerase sigma-70 factor, ECF subfamily